MRRIVVSIITALSLAGCTNASPLSELINKLLGTSVITGITGTTSDTILNTFYSDTVLNNPTVNWTGSASASSYDVEIKDSTNTITVCASVNRPSGATSYTFPGCALVSGTTYTANLNINLPSGSPVNATLPFMADNVLPVSGVLTPSALVGTNGTTYGISWAAGSDVGSGLGQYSIKLYSLTACGGGFSNVGSTAATSFTLTGLATSTVYSFKIDYKDNAGNITTSGCSGDIAVDNTPPTWVAFSAPTSVNYQNTLSYTVSWAPATDAGGSGLAATPYTAHSYTDATCSTLYASSPAQAGLSYVFGGLVSGNTYYFNVDVADNAGNITTSPCSGAGANVVVDTALPTWTSYITPTTILYQNTSTFNLQWNAASDTGGSGLNPSPYNAWRYTDNACTVGGVSSGWQALTNYIFPGLVSGTTYYFKVQVRDMAGNIQNGTCTGAGVGVIVDMVNPTFGGWLNPTLVQFQIGSGFTVSWNASTDGGGSGMPINNYTLKTFTDATCSGGLVSYGPMSSTSQAITLTNGTFNSFILDTADNAGNVGSSGCSGAAKVVMMDNMNPIWGAFTAPLSNTNINVLNYTFNWSAATDVDSGIHLTNSYRVNRYTGAGCSTFVSTTGWQTITSYNWAGLTNGTTYSVTVDYQDRAGNTVTSPCSNSVTVDTVFPGAFSINGVKGNTDVVADNFLTSAVTNPTIQWTVSGGASFYKVDIKDMPDVSSICAGPETEPALSHPMASACSNISAGKYRIHVTAYSPTGLNSIAASNDSFVFTQTGQWKNIGSIPNYPFSGLSPRTRSVAMWAAGKFIVWGGWQGGIGFANGMIYNNPGDIWSGMGGAPPVGRAYAASAYDTSHNQFIIWGGESSGSYFSDGGVFDIGSNTWTGSTVDGGSTPVPKSQLASVWDDVHGHLVVMGGQDAGGAYNSAWRYDTNINQWLVTTYPAYGDFRTNHTAVWDNVNNRMIIFGGWDQTTYWKHGDMYDTATDTWCASSTCNNIDIGFPWSPRAYHTAVWTGSKMIIWGGFNGVLQNNGAVYNPIADSWSIVSGAGAPSSRMRHTAVFDSIHQKMIIFGGEDAVGNAISGGAVYDFGTDTWEPMGTDFPPPTKRSRHTATWTGSEMMIWGGYDGSIPMYYNDGGVYVP